MEVQKLDKIRVREAAEKEVREERMDDAKKKVKSKMAEIEKAKKIVRNLERELEDILEEING